MTHGPDVKRGYLLPLQWAFIAPLLFLMSADIAADTKSEKATFAGGCFWCMDASFKKVRGVTGVISGYTGGAGEAPDYEDYASKGYVEAIEVIFDPALVTYEELLERFWTQIDPTDAAGQFVDRGAHYRTAIFYHDEKQKRLAEASKERLAASGIFTKPIVTEIVKVSRFYPAEEYHQGYAKKRPLEYGYYKFNSGRDQFLQRTWNGAAQKVCPVFPAHRAELPTEEVLRKRLTPLQYAVTRENVTERPFDNEFWNEKKEGIYVDVVSGEPLFSSLDKYDSGCGWPSFTKPLDDGRVAKKKDLTLPAERTEVRGVASDSHLGHVFNDGPAPTGLRYCINSAALRFIPKEDLKKEGYEAYMRLFTKK